VPGWEGNIDDNRKGELCFLQKHQFGNDQQIGLLSYLNLRSRMLDQDHVAEATDESMFGIFPFQPRYGRSPATHRSEIAVNTGREKGLSMEQEV